VPLNSGDLEPTISAANNIGKHFGAVSINLPHTRCSPLAFPATAFGPLDNKTGKMKLTLGGFGGFWGLGGWQGPPVDVRCLAFGCRCHLTPSVAAFSRRRPLRPFLWIGLAPFIQLAKQPSNCYLADCAVSP